MDEYNLIGGKKKWSSFIHRGVLFHAPYEPHKIPVLFKGREVLLTSEAEEMATLYAKCLDTEYVTNGRFNRNFWKSWKQVLRDTEIDSLADCDFSRIHQHLIAKKQLRLDRTPEEKKRIAAQKQAAVAEFQTATVDGKSQKVGNIFIEPTGIFIGRGCHPKLGTVKRRIRPEDIALNLSRDAKTPKIYFLSPDHTLIEMEDRRWGKVVHNREVEWIASWTDPIMGKRKYVWLSDASDFKSTNDLKKFELARKLKKKILHIRGEYRALFDSKETKNRQLSTAVYLIDKLALRVGGEKGEDAADTVGVTSLRVEHIDFQAPDTVVLDFLGKDTIRYFNKIRVEPQVYANLISFVGSKEPGDDLFDRVTGSDINEYLQTLMRDLTAKTFRTYNASYLFQHKLRQIVKKFADHELTPEERSQVMADYERANIEVAKLCNHQKKVVSSIKNQLGRMKERIDDLRKRRRNLGRSTKKNTKRIRSRMAKLSSQIKTLKAKMALKNELKSISLSTSKVNYIDPRISIAFAKRFTIPLEKLFTSKLIEKFNWAKETSIDFRF